MVIVGVEMWFLCYSLVLTVIVVEPTREVLPIWCFGYICTAPPSLGILGTFCLSGAVAPRQPGNEELPTKQIIIWASRFLQYPGAPSAHTPRSQLHYHTRGVTTTSPVIDSEMYKLIRKGLKPISSPACDDGFFKGGG